ncbi:hypothetical protein D1BOALGB6SA_3709 [Olavius sp. associated proteobacterium Delta 1]|nr:hypothetical protein D1BOALGB6SA_3709 [Olavius sp. associated proteobacterium Delta 1]
MQQRSWISIFYATIGITVNGSIQYILSGIVTACYTFITDEPQKQRIIQQVNNKCGIVNRESAKDSAVCFQYIHSGWDSPF